MQSSTMHRVGRSECAFKACAARKRPQLGFACAWMQRKHIRSEMHRKEMQQVKPRNLDGDETRARPS
eukprot:1157963-Pelagomonas_calceolata.AAC.4